MACGNNEVSRDQFASPPAPPGHPSVPAPNQPGPQPREDQADRFAQISQVILTAISVITLGVNLVQQQVAPQFVTQQDLESQFASIQERQIEERLEKFGLLSAVQPSSTPQEIREQ